MRSPGEAREKALAAARRLEAQTRRRSAAFGAHSNLFRDPAWDILLAAYLSREVAGGLPIKSLSVSSGVPMTTALRYLGLLETAGLLERLRNANDRRSTLMRMTVEGSRRMEAFLLAEP